MPYTCDPFTRCRKDSFCVWPFLFALFALNPCQPLEILDAVKPLAHFRGFAVDGASIIGQVDAVPVNALEPVPPVALDRFPVCRIFAGKKVDFVPPAASGASVTLKHCCHPYQ